MPGGLHVVALDVPDHGGAPGRLLAAEVAGVHAVLVGHEAVDERVEVGGGVARRRDRSVAVCKSGNCMGKSVEMMRNSVKVVGRSPLHNLHLRSISQSRLTHRRKGTQLRF